MTNILNNTVFQKLAAILLLCVLTVVFFENYQHYEIDGKDLLNNSDFAQGLDGWENSGSSGSISVNNRMELRIDSTDNRRVVYVRQHIKNTSKYHFLRFSGEMKTGGVVRGEKHWQTARLMVVGLNAAGKQLWSKPNFIATQYGSGNWQKYNAVFETRKNVKKYLISIDMPMVKGTLWVKGLSLHPVHEIASYEYYRFIAIIFWLAVCFWILIDYVRRQNPIRKQVLTAIVLCGILVGLLIPETDVIALHYYLLSIFPILSDSLHLGRRVWSINMHVIWHTMTFSLLTLIVNWCVVSGARMFRNYGLLILFALITEVLQLLADGRKAELKDFLIDVSAISITLILLATQRASRRALT